MFTSRMRVGPRLVRGLRLGGCGEYGGEASEKRPDRYCRRGRGRAGAGGGRGRGRWRGAAVAKTKVLLRGAVKQQHVKQ